jgi:hypothetical protein
MKKAVLIVAMLLVASVPVLAQDGYVDPDRAFNCAFLNGDLSAICVADEDGFYTTESGVRFPVGETDEDAYAAFIQYGGVPGAEPPTPPSQ